MSEVFDEDAFLDRLQSFEIEKWFAKPDALNPSVCVSRGWINSGLDQLRCQSCDATLSYTQPSELLAADEENVETFLQSLEWEHDADCIWCEETCPLSFAFPMDDVHRLRRERIVRFRRLNTIWDLPKLKTDDSLVETSTKQKIENLASNLHREWSERIVCTIDAVDLSDDLWRCRFRTIAVLSLLGWNLRVMDYRLTVERDKDNVPTIVQSPLLTRPESFGCCLASQCILECDRCGTEIGLWQHPSHADIPLETFKAVCQAYMQKSLQIVIDEETGEVEDLYRRTYAMDSIVSSAPLESILSQEDKNLTRANSLDTKRSLSLDLDRQGSSPVFGLQRLKKRKTETSLLATQGSIDGAQTENRISDGEMFDPIESHRHFCPYRSRWREILDISG